MWLFTDVADTFDRVVHEDEVFLDQWGTEAAAKHLRGDGSIELGIAAATFAGFKLSTTVAKGFIDVLRIGDGVRKGGWGYGEDALRALVIAGPALRSVRWASGLVASVDVNASLSNCTWVAAARSLRLSGRLFASVKQLAAFAGIEVADTGNIFAKDLLLPLRMMGAEAKTILTEKKAAFTTMQEVIQSARRSGRNGSLLFSVRWMLNGNEVGHTLVARWGLAGFRIFDRSGKVVSSLSELNGKYPGIGGATIYGEVVHVANAAAVSLFGTAPSLLNILALQVKPAVVQPAILRPTPPPATASAKVPKSLTTKKNMGRVTIHTTCFTPNSDAPETCTNYYTYQVVSGDSLSLIAKYAYKDPTRWNVIYQANKDTLGPNPHNPQALKAGMELFIPSR